MLFMDGENEYRIDKLTEDDLSGSLTTKRNFDCLKLWLVTSNMRKCKHANYQIGRVVWIVGCLGSWEDISLQLGSSSKCDKGLT